MIMVRLEVICPRQWRVGKEEDILIILSSSAHSPNLVKAVTKAKELGTNSDWFSYRTMVGA